MSLYFNDDNSDTTLADQMLNFSRYSKMPRYGMGALFYKSIKFEKFVEARQKQDKPLHSWIVCELNLDTVVVNAKRIKSALQITYDIDSESSFNSLSAQIRDACQTEIEKLNRSLKEPSEIDEKTKKFAELLFDDEYPSSQFIEVNLGEKEPLKFAAFQSNKSLRVIRLDNFEKLGSGQSSTIIKIIDVSNSAWKALKYETSNLFMPLHREVRAFNLCYGTNAKEGEQRIGWEIKPSEIFELPLKAVEKTQENKIVSCILKPINDEKDLLEFLENGKKMSTEAIIDAFMQLVIGLARFAKDDAFVLDISPENLWLQTRENNLYTIRIGDLAGLNNKSNLLKQNETNLDCFRKPSYRRYEEDNIIGKLAAKIEAKESNMNGNIHNYCEIAKKIDVLGLGICLYILINQSTIPPFYPQTIKILGQQITYMGRMSYSLPEQFKFLQSLFEKIFESTEKRISAIQLALDFDEVISKKYPEISTLYKTELDFIRDKK